MVRIIRANESQPPSPRVKNGAPTRVLRARTLEQAHEAENILHEAQSEAQAIRERTSIETKAYQQKILEEAHIQAATILVRAEQRACNLLETHQANLTQLAVRIAEKLLGEQLKLHPDTVVSVVQQCIKNCIAAHQLLLRFHPDDLPFINSALPKLKALSEAKLFYLEVDSSVERGGCIIETEKSQLDGQLKTQLKAMEEALCSCGL